MQRDRSPCQAYLAKTVGNISLLVYPLAVELAGCIRVWAQVEARSVQERVLGLLFLASFFRGDERLYFPWE
jgi:hypothetical protein